MPTIQETIEKTREFERIPSGWHFGDGVAPTADRIERAIRFVRYANLLGIGRANAFPGVNGQIEVRFYDNDRMLEITIEEDDSLTVAENKADAQFSLTDHLSISQVYERLNAWAFSDLFIESTTIRSVRVSLPRRSTFVPASQSRWLTSTAQLPRVGQFVITSPAITASRLEFQPYTGPFQIMSSQAIVVSSWSQVQQATGAIVTFIGEEETPIESLAA